MAGTMANNGTEGNDSGQPQEQSGYQSQEDNLRRDVDRLQALIEGNTLGPRATPPRSTPPPRVNGVQFDTGDGNNNGNDGNGGGKNKEKDKRPRRPTVDLEEETYRLERRQLRERERLRRRSRSESHREVDQAPLSPWSALGRAGRPEGYSRDQVNALGVPGAIALKGWEREEDRHREAVIAKPGKTITMSYRCMSGQGKLYVDTYVHVYVYAYDVRRTAYGVRRTAPPSTHY